MGTTAISSHPSIPSRSASQPWPLARPDCLLGDGVPEASLESLRCDKLITPLGEPICCRHTFSFYAYDDIALCRDEQETCTKFNQDTVASPSTLAVIVGNTKALTEELGRYDPLAYLLHRPPDGEDSNYLRRRHREQADHLLELVGIVEDGCASPPLIQPVMIDYSRIDLEIQEDFELQGIEQAISGQEWLRRSEERTMEEIGEGGASVIVYEPEEPEDEHDEENN
jgi:hypothetical protein